MQLKENERIITAWAESTSGPGWANAPLWVLIRDDTTGGLRIDALQPDEYAADVTVAHLYRISMNCHYQLVKAVESLCPES